jgi:hypothetical protein
MAWFVNHYHCDDCDTDWDDEWSCCCDDECPSCGSGDWSPVESDDLTFVVEQDDDNAFSVYESPIGAEHSPDYQLAAIALPLASSSTSLSR